MFFFFQFFTKKCHFSSKIDKISLKNVKNTIFTNIFKSGLPPFPENGPIAALAIQRRVEEDDARPFKNHRDMSYGFFGLTSWLDKTPCFVQLRLRWLESIIFFTVSSLLEWMDVTGCLVS
jgi:hypothetical protein